VVPAEFKTSIEQVIEPPPVVKVPLSQNKIAYVGIIRIFGCLCKTLVSVVELLPKFISYVNVPLAEVGKSLPTVI
jgi:hypothetical protein